VGRAGLYYPPDWPGLEVGWTIAREHWGKGYAPEAARAACAWAHDELGSGHILSLIEPANAQSIRVAEKLGETLEGRHSTRGFDLLVYGTDLPLDSPA
jgi:RimJ/RimL family protein N-acetyltransferase